MQITCANVNTHYQQLGHRGPWLVLLHGWGCSWEIFAPIVGDLSRDYRLLIPDLPGFGLSEVPPLTAHKKAWSSAEYVVWLQDFLQQTIDTQDFVIAGHSFGGKLAAVLLAQQAWLAQTDNTQVRVQPKGLILIDSAGLPDPLSPKEQLSYTLSGMVPGFLKRAIPSPLKRRLLASAQIAADYQVASPELQAILRQIVRENIANELSLITLPTLILWGAHDSTTPLTQGEAFRNALFDAELVVFDQSQHYPFVDQPGKAITTITAFLQKIYRS